MPKDQEFRTLQVVCFRCGECCTRYQVRLGLAEAQCIADDLGLFSACFSRNMRTNAGIGLRAFCFASVMELVSFWNILMGVTRPLVYSSSEACNGFPPAQAL
jgi:hypothetical protein